MVGRALLIVSLFVAVAQPSAAQGPTEATFELTQLRVGGMPIAPEEALGTLSINWTYTVPPTAAPGTLLGYHQLDWLLHCPSPGLAVMGPMREPIYVHPGQLEYHGNSSFRVQATRSAPGLEPIPCTANATVTPAGPVRETIGPAIGEFDVEVGYYGVLKATTASKVEQGGPGDTIHFDFDVTNHGNARTRAVFSVDDVPAPWRVELPDPLVLEAGQTGTAGVEVRLPDGKGWNNQEQPFRFYVDPTAVADSTQGGEGSQANVLARVRGLGNGKDSPAVGPWLPLGILAATLLARRR